MEIVYIKTTIMRLQNLFFSLIMTVLALSLSAQVEIKSTKNTKWMTKSSSKAD